MKGKKPMTLAEMAAKSSATNGRMACHACGCADFLSGGVRQGVAVTFRYRICRHCGKKYFTEQPPERILRAVDSRQKDEPEEGGDIV